MADPVTGWEKLVWFHSIDLGNGNVTPGIKTLEQMREEESFVFDALDVRDATVIDIGAWNGAFTFAASRRGARRVLAADSFVWAHPGFRGKEGFDFANAALRLPNIETKTIEVADISPETVGQFDVCLFLGVLYHLPSPLEGLERAASVARECLVVETQTDLNDLEEPALRYFPAATLANDDTNYFGPNVPFLIEALRELGFSQFDVRFSSEQRLVLHAWRSSARRRFPGQGAVEFHSNRPVSRHEKLATQLEQMRSSRSWRLTAPLRRVSQMLGFARTPDDA
jgi:tRNA (mo5U34)-methyltransferase